MECQLQVEQHLRLFETKLDFEQALAQNLPAKTFRVPRPLPTAALPRFFPAEAIPESWLERLAMHDFIRTFESL